MSGVICEECGQKVKKVFLPGRGSRYSYDSHKDRSGESCKGAGWKIPDVLDVEEWIKRGGK